MSDPIYENILVGNAAETTANVQAAIQNGEDPGEVLQDSMIAAMTEIGQRFEHGECFVPEMLVAARAMKAGLEVLRPHLARANIEPIGHVVLGTVQGDLHDIGKNLVGMMLEGAGFKVTDLGTNVPPTQFVDAVQKYQPQFVGVSTLLTTTMSGIPKVIEALDDSGLRDQVTVMVGGAPVTQEFAEFSGADLFAKDAASAAAQARAQLLGG
jgi:5-methyltetrahydrofolate--homocysteine methyltransferase